MVLKCLVCRCFGAEPFDKVCFNRFSMTSKCKLVTSPLVLNDHETTLQGLDDGGLRLLHRDVHAKTRPQLGTSWHRDYSTRVGSSMSGIQRQFSGSQSSIRCSGFSNSWTNQSTGKLTGTFKTAPQNSDAFETPGLTDCVDGVDVSFLFPDMF